MLAALVFERPRRLVRALALLPLAPLVLRSLVAPTKAPMLFVVALAAAVAAGLF